jgi:catechol 2,3-dioxygenase-like lactoylglutathione lyase family enzyme
VARCAIAATLTLALAVLAPSAAHADETPPAPPPSVSLMGAGYHTADLDRALRFWTGGLGMVEMIRLDLGELVEVILGFGGPSQGPVVLLLARKDGATEQLVVSGKDKLVLTVSDAAALRARLLATGAAPTDIHVHKASGTSVFFVNDPDGHRLEITQPPRAPQP